MNYFRRWMEIFSVLKKFKKKNKYTEKNIISSKYLVLCYQINFLIRITKFLLFLQYFVWKETKAKDNKNFVILIKKFIWQYRTKYFVELITFFSNVNL